MEFVKKKLHKPDLTKKIAPKMCKLRQNKKLWQNIVNHNKKKFMTIYTAKICTNMHKYIKIHKKYIQIWLKNMLTK